MNLATALKAKQLLASHKLITGAVSIVALTGTSSVIINNNSNISLSTCDGINVTSSCQDENGIEYSKYLYHEAVEEVTEVVTHQAESAKTHTVHHDAVYGTRQNQSCVKATMGTYAGQCATYRCADGAYSGAPGKGGCSHHGGVAAVGPFYTTTTETYVVTPAWDETIEDEPAKAAWSETVIVTPAKDAYIEKMAAE